MIHNVDWWHDLLVPKILLICFSAGLCAGLIVLLRPVLVRYALASPNARSSHKEPTPQGGGIAVVIATIAAFIASEILIFSTYPTWNVLLIVAATAAIAMMGAIDDIRTIGVTPR